MKIFALLLAITCVVAIIVLIINYYFTKLIKKIEILQNSLEENNKEITNMKKTIFDITDYLDLYEDDE